MRVKNYSYRPLTEETWQDLVALFGEKGASSGCWCMWWRTEDKKQFELNKGEKNRQALLELVRAGIVPGIIAYRGTEPVGWCSVAPREQFPRLDKTRNLQKVDDKPVWSIVCLFVGRQFRRQGVTYFLLRSAIEHVRNSGGKILEGYPLEPMGETIAAFVNGGFKSTYLDVGFKEVLKRGSRPIMRFEIAE